MESIVVILVNQHKQKYQDFLLYPENYARANYQPKAFKPDIIAEQNGVCGMNPEWNGKPLVFILILIMNVVIYVVYVQIVILN